MDIDFPFEKNLTIEAFIEEGKQARVYLTYNFPIDETVDSAALINNIETKAKVILSHNGIDEILILKRDNSRYPMLYYQSNTIIGTENTSYNLEVISNNKNYYAQSTMPNKHAITEFIFDSLSVKNENERDLYVTIENFTPNQTSYFNILIKDPTQSNKFTSTNRGLFTNSTATENDFTAYVNYPTTDNKSSFIIGDTIYLQLQSITKNEYEFWKSINGDITHLVDIKGIDEEISSNVENAFGFFGARNVLSYTIIIK